MFNKYHVHVDRLTQEVVHRRYSALIWQPDFSTERMGAVQGVERHGWLRSPEMRLHDCKETGVEEERRMHTTAHTQPLKPAVTFEGGRKTGSNTYNSSLPAWGEEGEGGRGGAASMF